MKKTILLFLTALMVFLFSACVRNGEDDTQRLYGTDLQGNGGSILYESERSTVFRTGRADRFHFLKVLFSQRRMNC